jgi:hypothetical protein
MARSGNNPGPGHNSEPLTDEEQSALTTHFALKVIADQRIVAQKKADLDGARATVNGHYKLISAELGITRKDFEAHVLGVLNMSEAEYANAEKKRARLHRLAGVSQGEQIDLIDHVLADTVDDAIAAEANGYRAGRRADDPTPPDTLASIFITDWMRGWSKGQETNGMQLAKAAELLARPKPGVMVAAEDEEQAEEDPADPAVIRKKANALKDSGWTEPTADEQAFEMAH